MVKGNTAEVGRGSQTNYLRICDEIRNDILDQRFEIGARLKIVQLASQYGVSQMPVREALQQLQGEGLVRIVPNRGAVVRAVNEKFIHNIYDIREILESFFSRRATVAATRSDIDELSVIQSAYERYTRVEDISKRIQLNLQFHARIYDLAGNEDALQIIDKHAVVCRLLVRRYNHTPARIHDISQQHRALIAAMASGNVDLAGDIAGQHMRDARDALLQAMREQPIPRTRFGPLEVAALSGLES